MPNHKHVENQRDSNTPRISDNLPISSVLGWPQDDQDLLQTLRDDPDFWEVLAYPSPVWWTNPHVEIKINHNFQGLGFQNRWKKLWATISQHYTIKLTKKGFEKSAVPYPGRKSQVHPSKWANRKKTEAKNP